MWSISSPVPSVVLIPAKTSWAVYISLAFWSSKSLPEWAFKLCPCQSRASLTHSSKLFHSPPTQMPKAYQPQGQVYYSSNPTSSYGFPVLLRCLVAMTGLPNWRSLTKESFILIDSSKVWSVHHGREGLSGGAWSGRSVASAVGSVCFLLLNPAAPWHQLMGWYRPHFGQVSHFS